MLLVRLVNEEIVKNPGRKWVARVIGRQNAWVYAYDTRVELPRRYKALAYSRQYFSEVELSTFKWLPLHQVVSRKRRNVDPDLISSSFAIHRLPPRRRQDADID